MPTLGNNPVQHIAEDAKNLNEPPLRKNWQGAKFRLGHHPSGVLYPGLQASSDLLRHMFLFF